MTWTTDQQKSPTPTSRKRSIPGARDRGAVAEIAESTHYKKRSMDTKKGYVENPRESYIHTSTLFSPSFKSFVLSISFVTFDLVSFVEFNLVSFVVFNLTHQ